MIILYYIGWLVSRIIGLICGMRCRGNENIPKAGPFIYASNHQHNMDPFLLGSCIWRKVYFFAKKELWNNPIAGWLIGNMNAFPFNRAAMDRNAMRQVKEILEANQGLVFFPEGTRGDGENLQSAKPGLGMLLKYSGVPVPIVPAYLHNSHRLTDCFWRRQRLALIIGQPIPVEDVSGYLVNKHGYQELADRIMAEIQKLKESGGY